MASAGLLFLMLMASSFLISIVSISASSNQDQLQENSSKKLDKAKNIVMKTLAVVEKIAKSVSPFMAVIPVHGSLIAAVFTLIEVGASGVNQIMSGDSLQALMNEFKNLNSKIDQYHVEQKWETWASNTYHKPEMKINIAWNKFTTMLDSVREAKDDNEKVKFKKEFAESYSKFEDATMKLQIMLNTKGTTFISPLGDLLAEHVRCHEKDVLKYTVLIHQLIYKGNLMNQFYYQLKGTESQSKVNDAAQIAYDAASVMFQVHMKCIVSSMEYIKKDVETLIDNKKTRPELAKEVWSFLAKEYDRYDWMVVAFKTKNSQKFFKSLNSHILSGFTEVEKQGISVAVARQVKGIHTKTALVKQTIGRCIDKSKVKCHDVANELKECNEAMEGIKVSKTYTAVHAYLREAHDSHNAKENPDEEYEVSAAPEDSSSQSPFIYKGECKKHLGLKSGKFVVLIRSDQEIMTENPCSNLNCGGEERGECVRMKDFFLAMCQCKQPYYGEHCEESLDDYKRDLEAEIEKSAVASLG